jgi:hypothetical protein
MVWMRGVTALVISAVVLLGLVTVAAQVSAGRNAAPPTWARGLQPEPPASEDTAVREVFAAVAAGRVEEVVGRLVVGIDRTAGLTQVRAIADLIPQGPPPEPRAIFWTVSGGTDGQRYAAVHEYAYPDRVVRMETVLARAAGDRPWSVESFHARAATRAELAAAGLDRPADTWGKKLFISAAVLTPLFMWATALAVLREADIRRRWLWLLFVLVGLVRFTMDSATGGVAVQPISFALFGAGAFWSTSAFEAWTFHLSLPVGAAAYWVRRARRRREGGLVPEQQDA